ncbi:hypothetical protein [Sporosarcina sp. ANT_H38]|uniref:hypothetical protein n=1 Tax=Sporosarcina sp. ANT_H38 TaxID=2597358 RepID=UPI00165E1CB7|nr:hypothetical protein [Sporosarcina sp. ANT_H38]
MTNGHLRNNVYNSGAIFQQEYVQNRMDSDYIEEVVGNRKVVLINIKQDLRSTNGTI